MDDRLNRHDLTDEEWQRLLRLAARGGRIAAPMIDQTNRRQVLVLRELGPHPIHAGRAASGRGCLPMRLARPASSMRSSSDRPADRHSPWRKRTETWQAITGVDPDRIEVCASSSLTGTAI